MGRELEELQDQLNTLHAKKARLRKTLKRIKRRANDKILYIIKKINVKANTRVIFNKTSESETEDHRVIAE